MSKAYPCDSYTCASKVSKNVEFVWALWRALWGIDTDTPYGELLKETRRPGYDGELIC